MAASGTEAGGHVGTVSTLLVVPQVVDASEDPSVSGRRHRHRVPGLRYDDKSDRRQSAAGQIAGMITELVPIAAMIGCILGRAAAARRSDADAGAAPDARATVDEKGEP